MRALPNIAKDIAASRWRSKLLWLTLLFILFEILSGFGLFFFRPFLANPEILEQIHTLMSLASLPVIWVYLVRHFRRVRNYGPSLHYRLGFLSMCCFVLVAFSGAWIWLPKLDVSAMDLVHIVSGFGFMVMLGGHLALVIRLNLNRR